MSKQFFVITSYNRQRIAQAVAVAPVGQVVRITDPTRTLEQNAKLHAIFSDVAKQETYIGRHLSSHQWKTLFISGHAIATGLGADVVPGLENEFVNIRESSANMTVPRMSSLIEYTLAWGAEHNIRWTDEPAREAA
jgi:hypothetical protein